MSDSVGAEPFWCRTWFLNTLSAATFALLVAFQVWWWIGHGGPILWVLLIVTPIFAFVPSGMIVKYRRRTWLTSWADAHGFAYQRDPGWPIPAWDFPPFSTNRARRQRIRDGMTGSFGPYPASFLHLTWINNNKVQASTHYRNVFIMTMPVALPRLTLGVTLDMSTGPTVQFESAVFNDRFHVQCADPRFAHAIFTPRTIDALLECSRTSGAVTMSKFEFAGNQLVATSTLGNRPGQISEIFTAMRIIIDGVPHFIWREFDPRPNGLNR